MSIVLLVLVIVISVGARSEDFHPVVLGNEILRRGNYELIAGEKVAVFSNPSGFFQNDLMHIVDDMVAQDGRDDGFEVVVILSPEHGFRGDLQAETGDPAVYVDKETGLPVVSAYKVEPAVLAKTLERMGVTCIVADVQDVGTRLYTFIWTLYDIQVAVALMPTDTRLVVLDRPNPLSGELVSGPVLNTTCCSSGYGKAAIPHVHGLTIGELSLLFADDTGNMKGRVEIVAMEGWRRNMMWTQTGLFWAPPSPNLPTAISAEVYPATVFIEATTVSEGRGTTTPFEVFGAPFYNALEVAEELNLAKLCGDRACFRATSYIPTFGQYNNSDCRGVQFASARSSLSVDPFHAGLVVLRTLMDSAPPSFFKWDGSWMGHPGTDLMDWYAGTPLVREMLDAGMSAEVIAARFAPEADTFHSRSSKFYIYS